MRQQRGQWYLLTGLLLGIGLGLVIAWVFFPGEYQNFKPTSLRQEEKDEYRLLVASSFVANGDLVRAKARLELLGDPNPYESISEQASRIAASGLYPDQARALQLLAAALLLPAPPTQ